jgi:hypothetical protein
MEVRMTTDTPTPTLPPQFKDLNIIATGELKLRRGAPGKKLDLRSPDEVKGTWIDDPDDIREAKKEAALSAKDGKA